MMHRFPWLREYVHEKGDSNVASVFNGFPPWREIACANWGTLREK